MTRHHKHKSRARLLRSLYIWHRYVGISTALLVIVLAVTGLALNHTEALKLDSSYVQSDLLLDWYGLESPEISASYTSGAVTVTAVDEHVFWGTKMLKHVSAPLAGLLVHKDLVVVAAGGGLALYTTGGELIEKLDHLTGVPADILAIGITAQNLLAVRTTEGTFLTDETMLEWRKADRPEVLWSVVSTLPSGIRAGIERTYRGTGLPLERVMLDLHSGRILGEAGVYLVDAAALLFLLLAISGVWLWARRRTSVKTHQDRIRQHDQNRSQQGQT